MSEKHADAELMERWREEKTAAWLYGAVAAAEPDRVKRTMFTNLAGAADGQAAIIARDMRAPPPEFRPALRARLVAAIVRTLGPRAARHVLIAMKVRGVSVYAAAAPIGGGHAMPTAVGEESGRRHQASSGGALRAGVFGVNDGLVSNTCLILGVAGATADARIVLLSGVAGLLAGAFSMAAGEYISMRSQREMYEYQIAQEREELEHYPAEEAEELALIYNARGIPMDQARAMTTRLLENPERALDTLAREELGLNPDDLGSPWGAAVSSFLAFCVGAALPLLPFLLGFGPWPIAWAAGLSAVALFAVGAMLSLFSGRSAVTGGLRMLVIGGAAAAFTYGLGALLGVSLG